MSKTDSTASSGGAVGASPWMTIQEAAKYARSGRDAIYNACRAGELKARQSAIPNGKWLIHIDDLNNFLRAGVA